MTETPHVLKLWIQSADSVVQQCDRTQVKFSKVLPQKNNHLVESSPLQSSTGSCCWTQRWCQDEAVVPENESAALRSEVR